jgi:hypothetical protein
MNKTIIGLVAGLAVGSGVTWLALWHSAETPAGNPAAPAATAPAAKSDEKPNPLRLPPARRTEAGIVLVKPNEATLPPEVPAFGRVLDPTTLVGLVAETETARVALAASTKERDRAKKLFAAGGNASAQAVETAEAAAQRDQAALASAQARLGATWGRDVAKNSARLANALAQGAALVRIDTLPGDSPAPAPKQVRLALPSRTESFSAEVIGPAPSADPQVQGASFLALVRESALAVGTALRATLPGTGEAVHALSIPRSAVVYHQGSAWVYVLGEEDTFERKLVALGRALEGDAVAVVNGLEPDEQVVATGAQQLLSAELQAGGAGEEP